MGSFVDFDQLTAAQRAMALLLRPKWKPADFLRFQFWVCPNGEISRCGGHHRLSERGMATIDEFLAERLDARNDLARKWKSADFTMAPER